MSIVVRLYIDTASGLTYPIILLFFLVSWCSRCCNGQHNLIRYKEARHDKILYFFISWLMPLIDQCNMYLSKKTPKTKTKKQNSNKKVCQIKLKSFVKKTGDFKDQTIVFHEHLHYPNFFSLRNWTFKFHFF